MVAKHSTWYHIILLITAVIILCEGTLSKSDRKPKINKRKSTTIGNEAINVVRDTPKTTEFHQVSPFLFTGINKSKRYHSIDKLVDKIDVLFHECIFFLPYVIYLLIFPYSYLLFFTYI